MQHGARSRPPVNGIESKTQKFVDTDENEPIQNLQKKNVEKNLIKTCFKAPWRRWPPEIERKKSQRIARFSILRSSKKIRSKISKIILKPRIFISERWGQFLTCPISNQDLAI